MAGRKTLCLVLVSLFMALFLAGCNGSSPTTNQAESATSKIPLTEDKPGVKQEKPLTPLSAAPASEEKAIPAAGSEAQSGNAAGGDNTRERVRLVVTRDFGQSLLADRWVTLSEPTSALAVTTGNLDTQTAYGGVFITSINGIASGYTGKAAWNKEKLDWFLYYNGKMAGTGADQITVKPGDVIWWDYHDWSGEQKPLPAEPPSR